MNSILSLSVLSCLSGMLLVNSLPIGINLPSNHGSGLAAPVKLDTRSPEELSENSNYYLPSNHMTGLATHTNLDTRSVDESNENKDTTNDLEWLLSNAAGRGIANTLTDQSSDEEDDNLEKRAEEKYTTLIQVATPPNPPGPLVDSHVLIQHQFANSYGSPARVNYTPPANLNFTNVFLLLETTVSGSQYDRLGHISFDGNEIWRTSTGQPSGDTTYYNYTKDVTEWLVLFKSPGNLTFQLDNVVTSSLTGVFNVTLTAFYYNANSTSYLSSLTQPTDIGKNNTAFVPPDSILSLNPSTSLFYTFPSDDSLVQKVKVPQNINRAMIRIQATGSGNEEFWWTNPLKVNSTSKAVSGPGAFREVQVLISDGGSSGKANTTLAGVAWPYNIIYSGGFFPSTWRPVLGLFQLDLPEYMVDITPYLPKMWSESGIDLKLNVIGADGNPVGGDWYLSYSLFLWEGTTDDDTYTSGYVSSPGTVSSITVNPGASNYDGDLSSLLQYSNITASRRISNKAVLTTRSGRTKDINFTQKLDYTSTSQYSYNYTITNGTPNIANVDLSLHTTTTFDSPGIQFASFFTDFDESYSNEWRFGSFNRTVAWSDELTAFNYYTYQSGSGEYGLGNSGGINQNYWSAGVNGRQNYFQHTISNNGALVANVAI